MDRKIFKIPFKKNGTTKYICPTCSKGLLKVKKETFHYEETAGSLNAHALEGWEPDWIYYVYSCLLQCTHPPCKDFISSSGYGEVSPDYAMDDDGEAYLDYSDYFKPKFFSPHLKAFTIPEDTPDLVKEEINTSFSLLFADPSSSANHIRVALEHLLTDLKIKRYKINNRKRFILSLHARIGLLPSKYDHIKDIFFAVKWLGNAGSHSSHQVNIDDVLDSYELMSELLTEIFANKRLKAKSLAKKINKKKGPK